MATSDMLTAFVKVADLSSVSLAAAKLGVSKSVVSKRIAQLEAELGATLFSRSTRKVALTSAGETYAEFARRALAELAAGDEHLRALRLELTGLIRLTATVSWGRRILSKKLPEFLCLHPGVELCDGGGVGDVGAAGGGVGTASTAAAAASPPAFAVEG